MHESRECVDDWSGRSEIDIFYEGDLRVKEVETNYPKYGDTITTIHTLEYDSKNQVIKIIYTNEDGEITCYTTYSYDEDGNNIETAVYNKGYDYATGEQSDEFTLSARHESIYNDEGIKIKDITYDGDGNVYYSSDYQ